jgi:hypothetical protein
MFFSMVFIETKVPLLTEKYHTMIKKYLPENGSAANFDSGTGKTFLW